MPKPPMTDAELAARALAGSADAFRQLVERYQRPILSLIVRMVRDAALAEDLAQEVFIKAYRKLATYDSQRKLSSWLFKIAHNTALDHLRRKRLETVPLTLSSSHDGEESSWEVLEAPADQAPDRQMARSQLVGGIERALSRLKPEYREILLLRFQQSLSYQEIVEVTGLRMNTVKVHLHRARKQLASHLGAAGFAAPEKFDAADKQRNSAVTKKTDES